MDERQPHPTEIKRVTRLIVIGRSVYVWGSDGQRDRVWRWRALPFGWFWRPRWRPHPGWQRCGLIRRSWVWVICQFLRAIRCRSVIQWDKSVGVQDLGQIVKPQDKYSQKKADVQRPK